MADLLGTEQLVLEVRDGGRLFGVKEGRAGSSCPIWYYSIAVAEEVKRPTPSPPPATVAPAGRRRRWQTPSPTPPTQNPTPSPTPGHNASGAQFDLGTHDRSKCADGGSDCCASEDWGEAQTCRDGYRPIPVTQDQCWSIHEGCAEYEGGKGCYGCFPPEGHNASGACLSCLFETLHLLKLSRLNLWIQSRYSRPEMQDHREVLRKEYKINQR